MSFLLFYAIGLIHNFFSHRVQKISSIVIALTIVLIIATHFFVYREFGDSFNYSMLGFAVDNPGYFLSFIKTYLFTLQSAILLIPILFYYWLWYPPKKNISKPTPLPKLAITLVLILSFYLIILSQLSFDILCRKVSPDVALIFASYNFAKDHIGEQQKHWLHASRRNVPEQLSVPKAKIYNILIVVNESWGKDGVWLYKGKNDCMPNLRNWIESENDNFTVFKNAFANASATAISVPSILTGVAPWESSAKLHSMPFLWDWAKAAGYRTMLVSSQYYKWANFDNFFFSPGPDYRRTADQTTLLPANDFGVDDIEMSSYFEEQMSKKSSEPFFAILQTNTLHSPFQQTCDSVKNECKFPSRYENALFILDAYFLRIKELLERLDVLDNTLVIFTSDHGDSDKLIHKPGRIVSFYDEVISIPILVRTPKSWNTENPKLFNNLKENARHNIANIDVAPTIVQFLGYTSKDKEYQKFVGKSLFTKIDSTRIFYALNTNETRKWQEEGFAIVNQNNRLIYSTSEGRMFYNISSDSNQLKNIFPLLSSSEFKFYNNIITKNPELNRIQQRCK